MTTSAIALALAFTIAFGPIRQEAHDEGGEGQPADPAEASDNAVRVDAALEDLDDSLEELDEALEDLDEALDEALEGERP